MPVTEFFSFSAYLSFLLPFQTGYATQNNAAERDNTHQARPQDEGSVALPPV